MLLLALKMTTWRLKMEGSMKSIWMNALTLPPLILPLLFFSILLLQRSSIIPITAIYCPSFASRTTATRLSAVGLNDGSYYKCTCKGCPATYHATGIPSPEKKHKKGQQTRSEDQAECYWPREGRGVGARILLRGEG
jgi:hypothetical protein